MARSWRCWLGLHRWQRLRSESGGWYKECRDCRKYADVPDSPRGVF